MDLCHLFSAYGRVLAMVCWSSGVQPKSYSPWLMMSLNSWKRAFSCCCWAGEKCSGTGGWRFWLAAGGGSGESARVTISRVPTVCLVCRQRGSGWWLCIVTQTSLSTCESGHSRHKCGKAFLWAEVYILAGPGVMAADQTRCFGGYVNDL